MTGDTETITDIAAAATASAISPANREAWTDSRLIRHGGRRAAAAPADGPRFEEVVLPHLDVARRLARWLLKNEYDADDAVQEASLRAFRYFRTFTGGDGRAWFLRIVRNTCSGCRDYRVEAITDAFDEEQHPDAGSITDPEALLLRIDDATVIARALGRLPDRFRQLLTLRELDGLSYRELAAVMGMPMGTVMSSLSRARQALRQALHGGQQLSGSPARPELSATEYSARLGD